jgi:hypothetical protein
MPSAQRRAQEIINVTVMKYATQAATRMGIRRPTHTVPGWIAAFAVYHRAPILRTTHYPFSLSDSDILAAPKNQGMNAL